MRVGKGDTVQISYDRIRVRVRTYVCIVCTSGTVTGAAPRRRARSAARLTLFRADGGEIVDGRRVLDGRRSMEERRDVEARVRHGTGTTESVRICVMVLI